MGVMRYGVHKSVEDEANAWLRQGQLTHPADPTLILTPAKEALRRRREVLVSGGVPDAALRSGIYNRAMNPRLPHLNSRDGAAPPMRTDRSASRSRSSLADFVERHLG